LPRWDDDDGWIESAIETAHRLGWITYIDESVMNLPWRFRECLAITDVELPENPIPKERNR